jgi:hypothetical protein
MQPEPDMFQRLLSLLRQYGWETGETGLAKLELEIQTTPDPTDRVLLQQNGKGTSYFVPSGTYIEIQYTLL